MPRFAMPDEAGQLPPATMREGLPAVCGVWRYAVSRLFVATHPEGDVGESVPGSDIGALTFAAVGYADFAVVSLSGFSVPYIKVADARPEKLKVEEGSDLPPTMSESIYLANVGVEPENLPFTWGDLRSVELHSGARRGAIGSHPRQELTPHPPSTLQTHRRTPRPKARTKLPLRSCS